MQGISLDRGRVSISGGAIKERAGTHFQLSLASPCQVPKILKHTFPPSSYRLGLHLPIPRVHEWKKAEGGEKGYLDGSQWKSIRKGASTYL